MTKQQLNETERLLELIEEHLLYIRTTQTDALEELKAIHHGQQHQLDSIRANINWVLYILIAVLISVSTGWFWE